MHGGRAELLPDQAILLTKVYPFSPASLKVPMYIKGGTKKEEIAESWKPDCASAPFKSAPAILVFPY